MKYIIAYIKPHKLDTVTEVLSRIDELTGMTVLEVKGFGRGRKREASPAEQLSDFVKHLKIEIFCNDELSEKLLIQVYAATVKSIFAEHRTQCVSAAASVEIRSFR